MKRSWGWKGAMIALMFWVGYVFAMRGLAEVGKLEYGPIRHVRPLYVASWRAHRALAAPGQALVDLVWNCLGLRLYPRISARIEQYVPPWTGQWRLCPTLGYELRLGPSAERPLPPWIKRYSGPQAHTFVRPDALPFLVHMLLLPGFFLSLAGALAGLALAAVTGAEPADREADEP